MNNVNLVYKCLVGSKAYGTDFPESDTDYKGIYIQNTEDILGFNYNPQIEVGKDETYYEIRRFLELAQTANPTILEMLFMPKKHIITFNSILEELFQNKHQFITRKCFDSFGGYAYAQIKKATGLSKKMNWEKEKIERKTPLDFCYVHINGKSISVKKWLKESELEQQYVGLSAINHMPNCYSVFYDWIAQYDKEAKPLGYKGIAFETSNDIRLSSIPKEEQCMAMTVMYYNKDAYSIHCKDYLSYQTWLKERNENRYVDVKNHEQKIDGKNMLHCIRLLDCCLEIAKTGEFNVERPNAEYLKKIRKGELDLQELINVAEKKLSFLDNLRNKTNLPKEVDKEFVNHLLIKIRKNVN